MQGKLRRHELADPSVFTAKVDKLLASGTDEKDKTARAAGNTTKKAPVKKKATPSKRKKATTDRAT